MKARAVIAALALALVSATTWSAPVRADEPPPAPPSTPSAYGPAMKRFMARATILDLNLEGGLGHAFAAGGKNAAFARARTGLTLVRDPFFESFGVTYEYSRWAKATVGLQYELDWQKGLWGQLGVFKDVDTRFGGGMLALGLAIVGVEGQVRGAAETGTPAFAVYGKLRLPIGLLIHAFRTR